MRRSTSGRLTGCPDHLRQELGLFACIRPCKYYPGIRSHYTGVDLVVISTHGRSGVSRCCTFPEKRTTRF